MDRYADGEVAAFGEIYDLLSPRLYAFFFRQTRDESRAEDLLQHTLLQIHDARASFSRGSDPVPWAFAIGRRLLIDAHRRTRREVLFATADEDATALDGVQARASGPEDLASVKEEAARVDAAIARLPEAQRVAYELLRQDGLSVAQAAEVLGTTTTAVKLRAHRAYEALRHVLAYPE